MDNCPLCGVDRDVWGKLHNCRPGHVEAVIASLPAERQQKIAERATTLTYQYRDPVKRRAQVAVNMKAYRARKKAKS